MRSSFWAAVLVAVLSLAPTHRALAATTPSAATQVAADYATVLRALAPERLTPYVSYVTAGHASGIKGADSKPATVVVRTGDGKVLQGADASTTLAFGNVNILAANAVSKPAFDPRCYKAVAEQNATWNNLPAVRFTLQATCNAPQADNPFTVLYADPHAMLPLAAEATRSAGAGSGDITQSYAQFAGRTMPSSLQVDIKGKGAFFWVHEHILVTYENYLFSPAAPKP